MEKLNYAVEDVMLQGADPREALRRAERETLEQIREAEKSLSSERLSAAPKRVPAKRGRRRSAASDFIVGTL